jgi:hypothetical protein
MRNPIIVEHMQNTGDQRYIWNIDLGALTGLPQSMTWHLENGLVLWGLFLALETARFLAHSPQ